VDDNAVWVPCSGTPALFRIDPLTNQVIARIAVNPMPAGVASDANAVWVTSRSANTLTMVDPATNQVTAVYPLGEALFDVIAAPEELFVKSEGAIWRLRP
jgi:YVTN family beta-propeller protein